MNLNRSVDAIVEAFYDGKLREDHPKLSLAINRLLDQKWHPMLSTFEGSWKILPQGTWVEIHNGRGDFSGSKGTIDSEPYGFSRLDDLNLPPIYNILVSPPYRERPTSVNFCQDKLRPLSPVEIEYEKKWQQEAKSK